MSFGLRNIFMIVLMFLLVNFYDCTSIIMPSFDRTGENVTVIMGNSATLPCFISNLGDHKVAWVKKANMDILAIGDYKVTNDDRIKLPRTYISDWSLTINTVNEEDVGEYYCQVNTEPQIIARVYLQVLLPPKINEDKSTISPEVIKEGQTLSLYCHCDGLPTPKVQWYFRRRSNHLNAHHSVKHSKNGSNYFHPHSRVINESPVIQEGSNLVIKNISRSYSGVFECIANNSVPPAASRKIKVSVEFAPEIQPATQKLDLIQGQEARFDCKIKANPLKNHYWMRNGHVIQNSFTDNKEKRNSKFPSTLKEDNIQISLLQKYEIITYTEKDNDHVTVSSLRIKNLTDQDFGTYECYAINSYKIVKAEFKLNEITTNRMVTTKTATSRVLIDSNIPQDNLYNKNYIENSIKKNENFINMANEYQSHLSTRHVTLPVLKQNKNAISNYSSISSSYKQTLNKDADSSSNINLEFNKASKKGTSFYLFPILICVLVSTRVSFSKTLNYL